VAFLRIEGERLKSIVAPWFGVLFWAVGAFSLFGASMGIMDYTSRLAADVVKSTYLQKSRITESRLYFGLVWGLVAVGSIVLLSGFAQPLALLIISASVGGAMMCLYSALLIVINRKYLPKEIRVRSYRLGALIWATVVFGILAALTIWQQLSTLYDGA
jgi:MFS family permease